MEGYNRRILSHNNKPQPVYAEGQPRKVTMVFKIHVPSGPDSQQGVQFVDENRAELIKRVTAENGIADALYSKKIVHRELYSHIRAAGTSQERMRLIYWVLNADTKKVAFLDQLTQEEPYLIQDQDADPPPSSSTSTTREVAQAEDRQDVKENVGKLERRRSKLMAMKTAQKQEMEFCRFLVSITDTTGPINEKLEDFKHQSVLFVDEHMAEFVERVTIPMPIADSLLTKKFVGIEQYSEIQKVGTNPDKMRLIYTALNAESKKTSFLELLVQKDLFFVRDLAKKKLEELEASNTAAD
ncbi:uncharacterized protein LOC118234056 [Anguilla anguilla]|uniref:uncharacterized protein LOC118234056 n=1 Tax=Anguilla anguilla TaxID=7936 RepID=UPI0015AA62F3|nr:uncharacterized protein LOC118234056 [Anguilla anguilla]